jgi:hypothetical protein
MLIINYNYGSNFAGEKSEASVYVVRQPAGIARRAGCIQRIFYS